MGNREQGLPSPRNNVLKSASHNIFKGWKEESSFKACVIGVSLNSSNRCSHDFLNT